MRLRKENGQSSSVSLWNTTKSYCVSFTPMLYLGTKLEASGLHGCEVPWWDMILLQLRNSSRLIFKILRCSFVPTLSRRTWMILTQTSYLRCFLFLENVMSNQRRIARHTNSKGMLWEPSVQFGCPLFSPTLLQPCTLQTSVECVSLIYCILTYHPINIGKVISDKIYNLAMSKFLGRGFS